MKQRLQFMVEHSEHGEVYKAATDVFVELLWYSRGSDCTDGNHHVCCRETKDKQRRSSIKANSIGHCPQAVATVASSNSGNVCHRIRVTGQLFTLKLTAQEGGFIQNDWVQMKIGVGAKERSRKHPAAPPRFLLSLAR